MTPFVAKLAVILIAVAWYIIRYPFERRARRTPVAKTSRGPWEFFLLAVSTTGFAILPWLWIATGVPRFADYTFRPAQAWAGLAVALAALVMFRLTHKALGRNWSVSLDVREQHVLVTQGVYSRVRHPMYTAFWLWAMAQALLLPNWFAGCSALVGFAILFFGRIGKEERLMIESFGDQYRAYQARTWRVFPGLF